MVYVRGSGRRRGAGVRSIDSSCPQIALPVQGNLQDFPAPLHRNHPGAKSLAPVGRGTVQLPRTWHSSSVSFPDAGKGFVSMAFLILPCETSPV